MHQFCLAPSPAGRAGRALPQPKGPSAHPTAVPALPPRRKAQSPGGEEKEGRLLPPCCPALLVASRDSPRPALWLGLCRSSGLCPAVVWALLSAFLPASSHKLPHGRTGGKDASPAKTPSDSCLASFGRRREQGSTLSYSSIFPAAVRLASVYKLYLSLSVCRGQMLSKESCSLQTVPKLGFN